MDPAPAPQSDGAEQIPVAIESRRHRRAEGTRLSRALISRQCQVGWALSGFGCGASPVPMTVGASFATGSAGLLVLLGGLLGPSGASAATGLVDPGFEAGGEPGAGAAVADRVLAFGGAAFFLARVGGRFTLSLTFAFGFGRACFRATDLFFALTTVFFERLFAADLARRTFALVLPFALAAFLIFALLAIVSSPSTVVA
jgi:hypothetical protein